MSKRNGHPAFGISLDGISLVFRVIFHSGVFDEPAEEIVDCDAVSKRAFVMNGAAETINVLDVSDIDNPTFGFAIEVSAYGSSNSVAVDPRKRIHEIAIALEAPTVTDNGHGLFYTADGR